MRDDVFALLRLATIWPLHAWRSLYGREPSAAEPWGAASGIARRNLAAVRGQHQFPGIQTVLFQLVNAEHRLSYFWVRPPPPPPPPPKKREVALVVFPSQPEPGPPACRLLPPDSAASNVEHRRLLRGGFLFDAVS